VAAAGSPVAHSYTAGTDAVACATAVQGCVQLASASENAAARSGRSLWRSYLSYIQTYTYTHIPNCLEQALSKQGPIGCPSLRRERTVNDRLDARAGENSNGICECLGDRNCRLATL
jgi:hypothetical protein